MTSRVLKVVLRLALILLVLLLAVRTLRGPGRFPGAIDGFVFSEGDAQGPARAAITGQLEAFEDGYRAREVSRVEAFARRLFSREQILVLGTMPREIYVGFDEATELVRTDWDSWGDCTFQMDTAHISVRGDTAWIATTGEVEFDLSRFLVMPLRLTGVMASEDGTWRFRQLQFQFDLDLSLLLLLVVVLLVWLAAEIAALLAAAGLGLIRSQRRK